MKNTTKENIIKFYPNNAAEKADNVLEQAMGCYKHVLILGWDNDGNFDPRSTISMSRSDILELIDVFKFNLLSGRYSEDD